MRAQQNNVVRTAPMVPAAERPQRIAHRAAVQ